MSKAHLIKFRCAHCGGRIAVPDRNLGKLLTCPECGRTTHPLAEQILAEQTAAAGATTTASPAVAASRTEGAPEAPVPTPEPAARAPASEATPPPATQAEAPLVQCANCNRMLGRLEKPVYWNGNLICPACHRLLSEQEFAARAVGPAAARPALSLWMIGAAVAVGLLLLVVWRIVVGGFLAAVLIATVLFGGLFLVWKGRSAVRRRLGELEGPPKENEAGWDGRLRRWVRSGRKGRVALATGVILASTAARGVYQAGASVLGRRAGRTPTGGTQNPPAGA